LFKISEYSILIGFTARLLGETEIDAVNERKRDVTSHHRLADYNRTEKQDNVIPRP